MKSIILSLLIAIVNSGGTAAIAPEHDPVFAAMSDEMARTMQSLKLDNHEKPYYVAYRINDRDSLIMSASFGAITGNHRARIRNLSVDMHVGNFNLDSGNSQGGFLFAFEPDHELSLDDNYDALRHKIWLQTDHGYKRAVQALESKKAELQQKNIKERPDDWTKEKPVVDIEPLVSLSPDRNALKQELIALSAIFKNYPQIRHSSVRLMESVNNRYIVTSEGTKTRNAHSHCTLLATATAAADDGTEVSDNMTVTAIDEKHLPPQVELEAKVRHLAQQVVDTSKGKEADLYQGPVLFEGESAAQFFRYTLAPHLSVLRGPDTESGDSQDNPLQSRLGRRILPTFVSIKDDPQLKDSSGQPEPGSYEIDDEGVRAQPVQLVEKGILKTLLSTREPTMKIKASNGHARGNAPHPSNIIVESEDKLTPDQLRGKLVQMGKDEGLDYVIVVRKLVSSGEEAPMMEAAPFLIMGTMGGAYGSDRCDVPAPIAMSKLFIADGHEEPLRPSEFSSNTVRVFRDIVATGDDSKLYNFHEGDVITSVTAPSILVTDLEIKKSHTTPDKPPVIPHPYFEKKQVELL